MFKGTNPGGDAAKKSAVGGGCLSIFGLPFLLGGLFVSWMYFSGYSDWWRAQSWVEVPCWIESTELKENRGDDSTTYQAVASYRYEYGGKLYHGERVSLSKGSDNVGHFHEEAHRELKAHVVGKAAGAEDAAPEGSRKPFRCYVNSGKPEEAVLYRGLRWQMQGFMAIFALTFPAVGASLVAGGFISSRVMKKDLALVADHPEQPWKWKGNWAGSSIPEDGVPWVLALHLYNLWAGLVIVPLIAATAMTGAFQREPMSWLLMIFVVLWCLPLWFSIRRLRQRLAIGAPRLELVNPPASPGGVLAGSILLEKPLPPRGDAELTLTCEKKVTRESGDGSTTTTEKIWSGAHHVPLDQITRDISGYRLPVEFSLPTDAPESAAGDDSATKHVWKLRLKVPGTAIAPAFEVPVFRGNASAAPASSPVAAVQSIHDTVDTDLSTLLTAAGIRAEFDSNGFPRSIVCPPARYRSLILFLAVFNLIWTGIAILLVAEHAPLIFRIVWPGSAALIWVIVFYQIFHRRTVVFDVAGLEVTNQTGPWRKVVKMEKSRIAGFSHDTNMQSGNTMFYRVRAEDVFGEQTTLADGIPAAATAAALEGRLHDWRKSDR